MSAAFDEALDIRIEREMAAPPEKVWRALTTPEAIERWFTPPPWRTVGVEIEPRPGGRFRTVMEGPAGERQNGGEGCVLVAEPPRPLAWTDALGGGRRPRAQPLMTVRITLEPAGAGTRYEARIMHVDAEGLARHEAMGLRDGWSTSVTQLGEVARSL